MGTGCPGLSLNQSPSTEIRRAALEDGVSNLKYHDSADSGHAKAIDERLVILLLGGQFQCESRVTRPMEGARLREKSDPNRTTQTVSEQPRLRHC